MDDSGGYLHHTPVRAGMIIVSCVCLHNLARITRMPLPPPEAAEDLDAFRRARQPHEQPERQLYNGPDLADVVRTRGEFITIQFGQGGIGDDMENDN